MNNRWGALLRFAIMKEALLNEDGALKRKPSSSVEAFTRENRFLPGIFPMTLTYLSENDIVKSVSRELAEETKKEEEPQSYLHIIGRYKSNGHSSVVTTPNGEEIPVQITCATRVEKGVDFSTDQILHFIGEKRNRTRKKIEYIVTGELYQLVTKYWYESEVINTLSDYMVLDNAQGLVKRILFDRKSARSILYFLAYAVSRAADGNNLADEDAVDLAVDEFNRQGFECLTICTDEMICLIEEMQLWDYLMPQAGFGKGDYFCRFLCVFALINGLSPWHYPGKNIGKILTEIIQQGDLRTARKIAQYMPYLCEEDRYSNIMEEIFANSKVQPYQAGVSEIILYESIVYHPVDHSFLCKAVELLFKDSIAEFQCNDIDNLLKGPNGPTIRSFVFRQFWEGIKSNEAAFNWITGSILNYEALNRGINPLEEAVESSILPFDNGDLLLSLSRISLLIWGQMDNHKKLFSEMIVSKNFVDVLLENVRTYNKLFYSTSASCLHDLIVLGWLSPELLNEETIYQTAIATLRSEEDGRLWSERLLSILPWNDNRELPPKVAELGREYATRLEQELQKKAETCEPEVTYSVLVHLGFYRKKRLEKMLAFQKLHKYYRDNVPDTTQKRRMQLLQEQLDKESPLPSE